MKKILFLLLISVVSKAQNLCHTDILNEEKISSENRIDFFSSFDFSSLWTITNNKNIFGVIGNDFQRINMQLFTVIKTENNPNEYLVYGKSDVKDNVCDFVGKIIIVSVAETYRTRFGADNALQKLATKTQGLLIAKYEFYENKSQKNAGVFSGELKTKWFLDKNNVMKYDNINDHSDSYFNNAFVGKWKSYTTLLEKICNWADFRVPNISCEFDIGAGEFSVSEKYLNKGWKK